MNKNNQYFYITIMILVTVVFLGNRRHFREQGVYRRSVSLSENLLAGNGYAYKESDFPGINETGPAFYPIWGYSLFCLPGAALNCPSLYVSIAQILLAITGVALFYKLFSIRAKLWHIPLFWPFLALMSVKWADAVAGFILLAHVFYSAEYLKHTLLKHLVLSGLCFGLLLNFRSEYISLLPFQLVLLALPHLNGRRKAYLGLIASNVGIALALMSPWMIRCYLHTSKIYLTGTNGGFVRYISLGELPDNPWRIKPVDDFAAAFVSSKGEKNPFSVNADEMLSAEFRRLVRENPMAFIRKVTHNWTETWKHGLYCGDIITPFVTREREQEIKRASTESGYLTSMMNYMTVREAFDEVFWSLTVLIYSINYTWLKILLLSFMLFGLLTWQGCNKLTFIPIAAIVMNKIMVVGLIQYQPRHINPIYLLLLGAFLCLFEQVSNRLKCLLLDSRGIEKRTSP